MTARLTSIHPILQVPDLTEATAWYARLGFQQMWTWGDPPARAGVVRDGVEIQLVTQTPGFPPGITFSYCHVVGVDDLYDQVRVEGLEIAQPLDNRPFGMRDFRLRDPGGNTIGFGEALSNIHAPLIVVVTGASGAGKTTLVRALEAKGIPGIRCYYFDDIGVPAPAQMVADYGSGEAWQRAMTRQWVSRLRVKADNVGIVVLDGQVRPSFVEEAFQSEGITRGMIVLVECGQEIRNRRLAERGQPELATERMEHWAAYLKGQSEMKGIQAIDTTASIPAESAEILLEFLRPMIAPS
ncbi:MAG: AAA family ATPase [Gemmatimonadota bacterium]